MKPDTAEELDTLAGEFVLGTLSPAQHAAMTERLSRDPSLRAAVDAWEARLLDLTTLAEPQPPSARLWGRIQRSLNELAPLPHNSMPACGNASACGRGLVPWGLPQACCWRLPC